MRYVQRIRRLNFEDISVRSEHANKTLKSVNLKMEPLQPGNNQTSEIVRVCEVCGVTRSEFSSDLLFREHYKNIRILKKNVLNVAKFVAQNFN